VYICIFYRSKPVEITLFGFIQSSTLFSCLAFAIGDGDGSRGVSVLYKCRKCRKVHQTTKPDLDKKNKTEAMRLPALPRVWCDYKDHIEFDLGNHLLANHKQELLKLPIGKGYMEIRIDHAIQWAKRTMRLGYVDGDDDEDEDIEEDSESNDDYE
jgi:hypothetical protein